MEEKEIKYFASKYLGHLYRDLVDVREHIAGSYEKLPKSEILNKLGRVNRIHDIADISQFKGDWFRLIDAVEKLPEEIKIDRQRIETDNLASDLANKVIAKQRQLREAIE